MKNKFSDSEIYQRSLFRKVGLKINKDDLLLDVGCGDGSDIRFISDRVGCKGYGIDIKSSNKWKDDNTIKFKIGSIRKIPFNNEKFDYVFLKDVVHHIDEINQEDNKIIEGFRELNRVCKKGGNIIIVENNRYNPISYIHMVKMRKHNHMNRKRFKKLVLKEFENVRFEYFESHVYPKELIGLFRLYEKIMEKIPLLRNFTSYNVAKIKKDS